MKVRICDLQIGDVFYKTGSRYVVTKFTDTHLIARCPVIINDRVYMTDGHPVDIGKRSQQWVEVDEKITKRKAA